MESFYVIHCIYVSNASLKYLAGHNNTSNTNHYPIADTEVVAHDRVIPAQAKLAHRVVMMASSGLKSAQ